MKVKALILCVDVLISFHLSYVTGGGRYWTEQTHVNTHYRNRNPRTVYEHQVKIYLYLDTAVRPSWYLGPQIGCDCYFTSEVSIHV